MNLTHLSDGTLDENTDRLVKREFGLINEILWHLREIERRRLHSQFGYKSLFDYATKRLGYADDQAARRISAMRLLKELPEIESKIASGALSLTNLGMAQTYFRKEAKETTTGVSKEQKLALLARLESKSKREAEKIIIAHTGDPQIFQPDRIRAVTEHTIEVKFIANAELQEKLERVKGLLAHSHPNMSLADAINFLCDLGIEKLDPGKRQDRGPSPAPALKRRITAHTRKQVWRNAESQCQQCGSTHALQVDHIKPRALGGADTSENLRLLCRSCNQRAAINKLGLNKMARFLDRPQGG